MNNERTAYEAGIDPMVKYACGHSENWAMLTLRELAARRGDAWNLDCGKCRAKRNGILVTPGHFANL
jgi:hypothetical protein